MPGNGAGAGVGAARWHPQRHRFSQGCRPVTRQKGCQPALELDHRVLAGPRQHVFAMDGGAHAGTAQHRMDRLLVVIGLALLHHQHRLLAIAKTQQFRVDERVGDIHYVQGDARLAKQISHVVAHERALHVVVQAAKHDDAQFLNVAIEELIETALLNEAHCGRPAVDDFFVLVQVARGWQHDATGITHGRLQRLAQGVRWRHVRPGDKAAVQVAGAHTQLQHHGRAAGF